MYALFMLSIQTYITFIVYDLSVLKVAQKIQVIDSLQVDDLCIRSQLYNWIIRELVFSYGSQWCPLELIFLGSILFKGYLTSLFICMYKGI